MRHIDQAVNMQRLIKCRTCNGCVALQDVQGYGLKCGYYGFACTKDGVPLTPCPKPKTIKSWIEMKALPLGFLRGNVGL